ncbi:MAG: response regulator [Bilophila wadsworthia]
MPGDIAISGVRILLIDDDPEFCSLLNDYLELNSISLTCAHDGQSGLDILDRRAFDLILLDMFLPDINGLDVLRRIRRMQSPPVVMLSAHNEETDRIIALEIGADDYVPKAFSSRELLARIRAVLRRCAPEQESAPPEKTDGRDILRVRDLTVNNHTKEAFLHGEPLNLTVSNSRSSSRSFRTGKRLSREDLLRITAERDFNKYDRSIDVHISSLRRKLREDTGSPQYIRTLRGVGYSLIR